MQKLLNNARAFCAAPQQMMVIREEANWSDFATFSRFSAQIQRSPSMLRRSSIWHKPAQNAQAKHSY